MQRPCERLSDVGTPHQIVLAACEEPHPRRRHHALHMSLRTNEFDRHEWTLRYFRVENESPDLLRQLTICVAIAWFNFLICIPCILKISGRTSEHNTISSNFNSNLVILT